MLELTFSEVVDLTKLRIYAEKNPISLEKLKSIKDLESPPPGEFYGHVATVAECRVVFSIEEHPKGMMLHASMSSKNPKFGPDYGKAILPILGFKFDRGIYGYREKYKDLWAINFLQRKIDDTDTKEKHLNIVK